MNILSIQSHVAYGHVGNDAAVFPMQRLGCEVWPIHTVQFSNHTGYGAWTGRVFDGASILELVDGIAARGVLASCDAVLSGYLGSAEIGEAVIGTVARVKAANPQAAWCCDPVIGDVGRGIFVRSGIPELMRDRAIPSADIVTPNQFELEWLTGRACRTLPDMLDAVATLHRRGPGAILVTSVLLDDTPDDALDMLASDREGAWRVRTPRLHASLNGAGDAVAALFLVHYIRSGSARIALEEAAASIHGVLRRTIEAGSAELLLVAAQDELVSPSRRFPAEHLRR